MKQISPVLWLLLLLLASCTNRQESPETGKISIIPAPVSAEIFAGFYEISSATVVVSDSTGQNAADYLIDWLESAAGFRLEKKTGKKKKDAISFVHSVAKDTGTEGYSMTIDGNGVVIEASDDAGFFYGVQSLLQLLPPAVFSLRQKDEVHWKVPCCSITDYPRFAWRGMHLDVSRHFFDVDFIKRYIDLIAMHKMNVFHWHLTDDNGWRIEIKKYPQLTEVAAWRVDRENMPWREVTPPEPGEKATYGGFYTQEDVRAVVQYAAERHITVIPEIEMPGHTSEVFAAYPELSCRGNKLYVQPGSYWPNDDIFCAGNEETFDFIEGVLDEVISLFPSPYVHIGGDEATKTRWKECPRCQQRIREEGLSGEDELQSWFVRRVEAYLTGRGKKMIGWDEILEGGLAPEATVMSWRGEKGGIEAARMGHDVIMCPTSHCYFDYYQANPDFEPEAIGGFTTLKKVYGYEPVPEALSADEARFVLGAQGNVWTEYIATPVHAEYMALPRMTALAEVVWSPKEVRDWDNFLERLQDQFTRFQGMGINYSRGSWKVEINPEMVDDKYFIELTCEQYSTPIHYTLDGSEPSVDSPVYSEPLEITESIVLKAALFDNGKLMEYPSTKEIVFHLATGKPVTLENQPARMYAAHGPATLVDGLKGSDNFRDGCWLGFEGTDVDLLIDLGKETAVNNVNVDFYQNTGSWIFMPGEVIISLLDEDNEVLAERVITPESTMEVKGTIIETMTAEFGQAMGRFIIVRAPAMTEIPGWHEGAGHKGWLFLDEVVVE